MKKLIQLSFILLGSLACGGFVSCSSSEPEGVETTVSYDSLPANAKKFIADYYSNTTVSSAVEETISGITLYRVTFANGQTATFNAEGNWTELTATDKTSIPEGILPDAIKSYLNINYSNYGINSVTRTDYGYDINIANNVTLRFDFAGAFLSSDPN